VFNSKPESDPKPFNGLPQSSGLGVRGSIRGMSVALHGSAQVEGEITHQKLAISEGAHFDGRVRKSNDTSELMPVLDPEAISSGGST
jgi:cytoskeletal protein CcmA (bactofilin family)